MSEHRIVLYGAGMAVASALLWAGFVRRVDADAGTLVRGAELGLRAAAALPERLDGGPNAVRSGLLARVEADLAIAERAVRREGAAGSADDALPYILECRAYGRHLAGDRQGAVALYLEASRHPGCDAVRRQNILMTVINVNLQGRRPAAALETIERLAPASLPPARQAGLALLRAEALLMQGRPRSEVRQALAAATANPAVAPADRWRCAEILAEVGLPAEAAAELERAAPEQPRALVPLARLKLRGGDVEGATVALLMLAAREQEYLKEQLRSEPELAPLAGDPRLAAALAAGK